MGHKKESSKSHVNNVPANSTINCDSNKVKGSDSENIFGRNQLSKKIGEEYKYLTKWFNLLDLENLSQGKIREDENEDLPDIPEKKVFQKKSLTNKKLLNKKRNKSFPQSIEDLEKELEELKGTPLTYQKQLRKKGLQVRLTKKTRKENLKQQKAALKQGAKLSGPGKPIKPVLNSDGNVVSNKFDFADSDVKKESKRKHTTSISECVDENERKKKKDFASNSKFVDDIKPEIKNENNDIVSNGNIKAEDKTNSQQGPLFNKENKMVFSKVIIDNNIRKQKKKKVEKDPKKLLEKIKEDSKKLLNIEKEDKDKALVLKEKQKWSIALKRASGEKVKDDPELLKKSIIKEKNKKMRSQKKWQARTDRVEKDKEERQNKRKENLKARKLDNKKRKMKKAVKKGRYVQV